VAAAASTGHRWPTPATNGTPASGYLAADTLGSRLPQTIGHLSLVAELIRLCARLVPVGMVGCLRARPENRRRGLPTSTLGQLSLSGWTGHDPPLDGQPGEVGPAAVAGLVADPVEV